MNEQKITCHNRKLMTKSVVCPARRDKNAAIGSQATTAAAIRKKHAASA
jgi:hypothetical protein